MISPFSTGNCFDSAFSQGDPQEVLQEIKRINRLYVLSGTAMWFQQYNMVHLSENWFNLFNVSPDEMFLLEDYIVLIENPEERKRISIARESLISQEPGFEWSDSFTLFGQRVQSTAVVAKGCIFGMDRVIS